MLFVFVGRRWQRQMQQFIVSRITTLLCSSLRRRTLVTFCFFISQLCFCAIPNKSNEKVLRWIKILPIRLRLKIKAIIRFNTKSAFQVCHVFKIYSLINLILIELIDMCVAGDELECTAVPGVGSLKVVNIDRHSFVNCDLYDIYIYIYDRQAGESRKIALNLKLVLTQKTQMFFF